MITEPLDCRCTSLQVLAGLLAPITAQTPGVAGLVPSLPGACAVLRATVRNLAHQLVRRPAAPGSAAVKGLRVRGGRAGPVDVHVDLAVRAGHSAFTVASAVDQRIRSAIQLTGERPGNVTVTVRRLEPAVPPVNANTTSRGRKHHGNRT